MKHRDGGDFAAQPPETSTWPQEGPGELGHPRPSASGTAAVAGLGRLLRTPHS